MKFGFIAKHRSIWPVAWLCDALGVPRSGFHAWLHHGPSARTYGARRVWRDVLADGASCGLHKIERLMRANALRARPRRPGLPKEEGERSNLSVAPNALDRQFSADQPNRKWISDFT